MQKAKLRETKWRQIIPDNELVESEEEKDSDDEDANHFATFSELDQSRWISEIIRNEPISKVYIRREDFRVGGYRADPNAKIIKSWQK